MKNRETIWNHRGHGEILCCLNVIKSGRQEFFVFYLGEFLNSKYFIFFVSWLPFSYLVLEQGKSEDTEDNNREDTEGRHKIAES